MLVPKRVKHRKVQRGSMKGKAKGGTRLNHGSYGIQALEAAWITNRQIEAARIAMTRYMKRGGKVWRSCLSLPGSPGTVLPLQRSTGRSTNISARTLKRRRSTRPLKQRVLCTILEIC